MKSTIDPFLELIKAYCDVLRSKGFNITFDSEKKGIYRDLVKSHYDIYKSKYMDASVVENLDRHKIAAILVATGLECDIIKPVEELDKSGKIYIGRQKVLLLGAFDYLLSKLNECLKQKECPLQPMKRMLFPLPWSCETDYVDVFARNLYYEEKEYGKDHINIMELAEKFFLLEYISIQAFYRENAEIVFEALTHSEEK